jgi:uncharacterized protein (TIGR02270 family)
LKSKPIIESVVFQHTEEAAFLWLLRDSAVAEPHYSISDLAHLDSRIHAHLEGLRVSGEAAWEFLGAALLSKEADDTFAASVLALESAEGESLSQVLTVVAESREAERGFVSALGWVSEEHCEKWMPGLLRSESAPHVRSAIAALAIRRAEMVTEIEAALRSEDDATKARALRAIGETKQRLMATFLAEQFQSDDESCRFWAAWSSALVGDRNVGETLKSFVNFDTEFAYRAIQLAPRILESQNCQDWLRGLAQDETTRRYALIGCGVTGDPVYIPTLISQMAVPEYARVAGEAFSMITGVDLAYEDLDTDQPEGFEAGPTEDPADENVDLDPDEDLPWPDPELIDRWWHEHAREYQSGVRYLCGRPISDENCRRVLREGYQRQRISAAYELALMNPDEPLFEWRAPGFRQQEWLGLRKPSRRYRR